MPKTRKLTQAEVKSLGDFLIAISGKRTGAQANIDLLYPNTQWNYNRHRFHDDTLESEPLKGQFVAEDIVTNLAESKFPITSKRAKDGGVIFILTIDERVIQLLDQQLLGQVKKSILDNRQEQKQLQAQQKSQRQLATASAPLIKSVKMDRMDQRGLRDHEDNPYISNLSPQLVRQVPTGATLSNFKKDVADGAKRYTARDTRREELLKPKQAKLSIGLVAENARVTEDSVVQLERGGEKLPFSSFKPIAAGGSKMIRSIPNSDKVIVVPNSLHMHHMHRNIPMWLRMINEEKKGSDLIREAGLLAQDIAIQDIMIDGKIHRVMITDNFDALEKKGIQVKERGTTFRSKDRKVITGSSLLFANKEQITDPEYYKEYIVPDIIDDVVTIITGNLDISCCLDGQHLAISDTDQTPALEDQAASRSFVERNQKLRLFFFDLSHKAYEDLVRGRAEKTAYDYQKIVNDMEYHFKYADSAICEFIEDDALSLLTEGDPNREEELWQEAHKAFETFDDIGNYYCRLKIIEKVLEKAQEQGIPVNDLPPVIAQMENYPKISEANFGPEVIKQLIKAEEDRALGCCIQ